jgi:hypothetical protein
MSRPQPSEYAPYYGKYIDLVPEEDIVSTLRTQVAATLAFLSQIPEEQAGVCHPPYTWTARQVVSHLCDCERVFGYRALRFARGDETPLPAFDEELYAQTSGAGDCSLSTLANEFAAIRNSHVCFFTNLPAEAWDRVGAANNTPMSVRALAYVLVGHERHHGGILRKRLALGA